MSEHVNGRALLFIIASMSATTLIALWALPGWWKMIVPGGYAMFMVIALWMYYTEIDWDLADEGILEKTADADGDDER